MKRITLVILLALGTICSADRASAALSPDLSGVIVYPNPFDPRQGHATIAFGNLTATARIRVFKINGELVLDKNVTTVDGKALWDVKNNDGAAVANGVYLYLITNDAGHKKAGKLAIMR